METKYTRKCVAELWKNNEKLFDMRHILSLCGGVGGDHSRLSCIVRVTYVAGHCMGACDLPFAACHTASHAN
jgi:hypothetical protein